MWILQLIIINSILNKEKRSPKSLNETKQTKILNNHDPTPFLPHYPILNPSEKQLYKWKAQYYIGHWNCKGKVKMSEMLYLSLATIQGLDR